MWILNVPPPTNPLIEQIKEPIAIVEQVKELTVEEKIAQNYYKCDESIQYIRADNAECLDKRVNTPVSIENTPQPIKKASGNASSGWYTYGYCTEWVASQRSVGQWGDASSWKYQAQADGWTVSSTPIAGAIAWQPGHVAYVESVGDGVVIVSEKNYKGWNVISTRTVPISTFQYIY